MSDNNTETPAQLFHFCALNTDDRKQWVREILEDNRVYFRRREELNDPNELRPDLILSGTDKQKREYVRSLIRKHWPIKLSPADRLQEESKLMRRYRNQPAWAQQMLYDILDKVGVFCLSETSIETLLWAHYAAGHRGIAIEFDPSAGLFATTQRVVYGDKVPVINRLEDSPQAMVDKSMLTKGMKWSYEKEWRVIARWGDEVRIDKFLRQHVVSPAVGVFMRDQHGPGHYSIPSEAVRSVILGHRISGEDEAWLRALIEGFPAAPTIRRASLARDGTITIA